MNFGTKCWFHAKQCVRKVFGFVRKNGRFFTSVSALAVLVISVWATIYYWNWLGSAPSGRESYSTTLRNVGLVFGGVLALALAFWRSKVADRQANTAQHDLLEQRYQKGLEMLGKTTLSERVGAVHELQRLSEEHPKQYHVPVMRQFCAFVSNPIEHEGEKKGSDLHVAPLHEVSSARDDVQAVMEAIGTRRKEHLDLEAGARFQLNLHGSDLSGTRLIGANLVSTPLWEWTKWTIADFLKFSGHGDFSDTKFCSANLGHAELTNTDLSGACLCKAWLGVTDLSGANLSSANLHGAIFVGSILSGTKFSVNGRSPAKGITQSDLDYCKADPENLPDLSGVRDFETNEPLFWSGKPLDD